MMSRSQSTSTGAALPSPHPRMTTGEYGETSKYFPRQPSSLLEETPGPGYATFASHFSSHLDDTSTPIIPSLNAHEGHTHQITPKTGASPGRRIEFGVNRTNYEAADTIQDFGRKGRKLKFAEENLENGGVGQGAGSGVSDVRRRNMLQWGTSTLPKSILRKSPTPEIGLTSGFISASSGTIQRSQTSSTSKVIQSPDITNLPPSRKQAAKRVAPPPPRISGTQLAQTSSSSVTLPSPDITNVPPSWRQGATTVPRKVAPPSPHISSRQLGQPLQFPHPFTEEIVIEPSMGQGRPGLKSVKLRDQFTTAEFVDLLLDDNTLSWDILPDPVTQARRLVFQQKIE